MMTGRMNWWTRIAALTLAALFVVTGCSEQPVDVRNEQDVTAGGDPDVMFDDILGFLDAYASRGLAAGTDPTLLILGPSNAGQIEYTEPATSVDFVMLAENWDYPQAGRSLNCYIDGGAYDGGNADGYTQDLEYTFADVPAGFHRLCCVMVQDGEELKNCEATACVDLSIWQLCDYLSDPICDDLNPVSASACLWDSNLQHRKCVYGLMDVEGLCLSKHNCECNEGIGWEVCVDNDCTECFDDGHCDDGEPCTIDTCNTDGATNFCEHTAQLVDGQKCCSSTATQGADCNDLSYCTNDLCVDIDPITGMGHCDNPDAGYPDCCDTHSDCDDGDPCSVNACLAHECREGPKDDPLCCNPANGDADCDKGDPCYEAYCNPDTVQCEWTKITYAEQVGLGIECCETHPDCMAGGIWEEEPSDNPATLDYCQDGQCVHLTDPGYCECEEGEGCAYPCLDDGEACTTDGCNLATNECEHAAIENCCLTDDDCEDANWCTDDACVAGICQHVDIPAPQCCNTHEECDDGNPCNIDKCFSHACHFGPNPETPNCCNSDDDCDDLNTCTEEVCITAIHECVVDVADPPPAGKECCLTVSQCDDSNPNTQDQCIKNVCYHFVVNCSQDSECNDNQPCTQDSCDIGGTGKCENVWQADCCTSDLSCNLAPLMPDTPEYDCKEGTCGPGNACVFTNITDCCADSGDCDDLDACTTDICINKKCKHVSVSGCCAFDVDCEDNNSCTLDSCENGVCVNQVDYNQGGGGICCASGGDCADGDACSQDICQGNLCYHNLIPGCCVSDAECADQNACTCDRCVYGKCRHLPPDQAASYPSCSIPLLCCQDVGDCQSDDNPCTDDACVNNLCEYPLQTPCNLDLPYVQEFTDCNNVQPEQGWLKGVGFSFVELGTNSGQGNWKCSTDGPLGSDKHQRFNWAPTVTNFDSYLVSPALDCVGTGGGYDYVTVMHRQEFAYYDDVTPKTDLDLGLYILEESGDAAGPDALDTLHELSGGTWQEDYDAEWAYNTVPAVTGYLGIETHFAWRVGGETSYALNHWDLDNIRICKGRPPYFTDPTEDKATVAMRMDDEAFFNFVVKDLDVNDANGLDFELIGAPSWVKIKSHQWDAAAKQFDVKVHASGGDDIDKLGEWSFTLRANDLSSEVDGMPCLFSEIDVTLWVLVNDGYIIWDPEDEAGSHSDSFADAMYDAIEANDRRVQIVEDITLFEDLDEIRGVFVTLGIQGLDYVLTDLASADADAIDLLSDYLANGGRVYLEGGNTWGFDTSTDLHSQYYFPVTGTAGTPEKFSSAYPPGAVEGKHFCWGENFLVSDSASLTYGIDTLAKKVGSSAIPIVGIADGEEDVAISFESATFECRTIAATLPFAALVDGIGTQDSLMGWYIYFFENGYPPCSVNDQCFDSEVCTVDTCIDEVCDNTNEPDCIPCEDDQPCTASAATKACAVSSGICGALLGTEHVSPDSAKTITYGSDVTSTITVAGTDLVQKLNIKLYLTHNYRGDLTITLEHGGHTANLKAADPTDNGKHYYFTYDFGLDSNEMDQFVGEGENGDWTLTITDEGVPYDGSLASWSLFIVSAQEECVQDSECDDGSFCTIDTCEIELGESSGFCAFNADPCDDIDACVYFDYCDPAADGCVYGDVNCDDGNPCSDDSCDPVTGCVNVVAQHCTTPCASHAECGYDDYCDMSGGLPGTCTPIPNDQTFYCDDCPKTVTDQATTTTSMALTDTTHYIDQIYVKVMLQHTYQGQLTLTLSNGDETVTLHEATGGSIDDLYKVYEIADAVHVPGSLSDLHHFHPDGTWTLSITDGAAGDVGTLDYWTIYVVHATLLDNGEVCDNEDMCTSDFCGNGFCCNGTGTGDCCAVLGNCQNGGAVTYWVDPACDTAADCQGHRVEPLCINNECVATDIDDDSACDGLLAAPCTDCRPNPICSDDEDQDDPLARCPATCGNDDAVCDSGCYCDGTAGDPSGTCVDLLNLGELCDEESDCDSGLHCQNGVCCTDGEVCCTDWSQCPNDIGVVNPLDQYFSDPECGATPSTCQGTREDKVCTGFQCGYDLAQDDTDCGVTVLHSHCGYYLSVYCDATVDQTPACATSCASDADCDANAHCDASVCVADHENGHDCNEGDGLGDNECVSDHCQNGFCCTAGDCCAGDGDCGGLTYDVAAWCASPSTCQGSRKDAVCVSFACQSSAAIDDDTACDTLINCAPYAYDLCDGTEDQPIAACPTICVDDDDCVTGAHCSVGPDALKHCYYDKVDCDACAGNWECVSGNCNGPAGQETCCAAGKDCVPAGNAALCDASYSSAAVCGDGDHCQGTRVDATATACACGSETIDDDTACTAAVTAEGIECSCFPHPICDGTADQNPVCATTCVDDTACVDSCTCDGGTCTDKLSNGEVCDEDADCLSESCSPDGVCCDLSCDGVCESCGLTWDAGDAVTIDGDYDGADDFDAVGHRLGTGAAGVYYLLTWDDTYIYVAWEGANLQNDNVYVAFDIDKDPNPDQGASSAYGGVTFTGFRRPEYAMVIHEGDSITYSPWDGAGGWDTAQDVCPFPASCWAHYGGWSGNGSSELRIPRAYLGGLDPDQGFAVWMWANNNAENFVWSVWPSTNSTGAGVQDAPNAQFMKLGAGQCTKRPYNTDGETECLGDCNVCDGLGACMSAVAGSDPNDDCTASAPDSCGLTGDCGSGACAFWDGTTPCGAPNCIADGNGDITLLEGASFCTGAGACVASGDTPCFPHLCITDACKDPCEVNTNCVQELTPGPGYYCNNRALNGLLTDDCELKLADSLYCDEDSDCQSGHCVEIGDVGQGVDVGVCCATACNGHCNSCVTGACVAYADFADPDGDCGGCEVCDGAGTCRPVDPVADPLGDPKFFCAQNGLPIGDTEWDCGLNGECDGLGACDKWNDGEYCHNSECMNCKIEDQPDFCDADGLCQYMGPGDPCDGNLACSNTVECRTSCGSDSHCCGGAATQLCHADGYCDPCDQAGICPTDGSTCCESDSCSDTKLLHIDVGTVTYLSATEGAADDFDHAGLGANSPDRVYTFSTVGIALEFTAAVVGTKDGGAPVDTWMYLREGDCEAGTVVASNDDCGGDPTAGSCLSLQLKANKTYFLVIDGKGSATDKGDIALTTTFDYFCGNGTCDPGEICGVCADCSPCCGDSSCDVLAGENSCTCTPDCETALASDNACDDGCCSEWDCANQCGDDCDMCEDCTFCADPVGEIESVTFLAGDTYTVVGWACDPDHVTEAVNVEIHDDLDGLEGTFATGGSRPDQVANPLNTCGEFVGFTGVITLAEEGAHTITAFGQNVDVTEAGAWLNGSICQGVCGAKVCGDDGCGESCGTCTPMCQGDGDGSFSAKSDACSLGVCATLFECGTAYACDGALSKEDGDACATACQSDDDDYCAVGYTCEGVACVAELGNGESCDEDADCASDNCRKEISSANFYCAAAGRECSDLGGDGYDAGEIEDPWICTDVDVSVECKNATRCNTWFGRYCTNENTWTLGSGTSYTCAVGDACFGGLHYADKRCDGEAGAAGSCDAPGNFAAGCSDETVLGAFHCEGVNWTTVGPTSCCEDDGAGAGVASDPCAGKHVDCVASRTCADGADSCQMVAAGTTCDASGYCIETDPDWCASGKANGEECAGDFECASKHCDPDLAGVDRCHATETSCVQDHTGAETVTGAGFCVTGSGYRVCTNALWSPTVTNCVGCESCVAGSCQDDNSNCVQSSWDGCIGTCFKTRSNSGQCLAGVCGTETQAVSVGTICDSGNEAAPSGAGYCDATITCVATACTADLSYRGCDATGNDCTDTGAVNAGAWNAPLGAAVSVTEIVVDPDLGDLACQTVVGMPGCDDTDHCSGDDWYDGYTCDGTGDCDSDIDDIGCCAHSDCAGTEYCDTDHACKALPVCAKPDTGTGLGYIWQTDLEDLYNQCNESAWDGCDGTCQKTKSNTGFCSGIGGSCGTDTTTLAAGTVCVAGVESDPGTAGKYCDMAVTCTTGTCSAMTHYRGCSATGVGCVDLNKQDATLWNAPAGEVISESVYKLGTTCASSALGICSVTPHCTGEIYYAGYACDGGGTCDQDTQAAGCCTSAACASSEYCVLTTHTCTDLPTCSVQDGANGYTFQTGAQDLWDDCADDGAWDGCIGSCIKTKSNSGLCSGTGFSCGTDQTFVSQEGKVCSAGVEVAASQAIKCSGSIDCVSGDCSADRYWLGCSGTDTTCSHTGKTLAVTAWNAPVGTVIDTTEYKVGATCSSAVDFCSLTDHCSGDDWYEGFACDGSGACLSDLGDQGCCDHTDCGAAEFCNAGDHQCTALPLCAKRSAGSYGYMFQAAGEDLFNACGFSGWDGCQSACVKTASNSGSCSGTAYACGTDTENVSLDGKVCAGPGLEVSPFLGVYCDVAIDCVDNDCSATRWFRGCAAGTTTCTDTGHVGTTTWYAGNGQVINETASHTAALLSGVSCSTDASACADTDHCSGDDYYDGYTCNGSGACDQSLGDIGCCNHTDCASGEYCEETNHTCTALPLCTKPSASAFGYQLQSSSEDLQDDCTDSGFDGCDSTCVKAKSNSGFCSGTGQTCGTVSEGLSVPGKVCDGGAEVDPSAAIACDTTVDCASGDCAVLTYYRGCAAGASTCVDNNRQAGPEFEAPIGTVIDETNYKVGTTCVTSAAGYCQLQGHCVGKDWLAGYICDGNGGCTISAGDAGCCENIDCGGQEYCNLATHACTALPKCTQQHSVQAYGYENQPDGADLWDECTAGTWSDCVGACVKRATGGNDCDGNGACYPYEYSYLTAGKVCDAGAEIAPSSGNNCSASYDCVDGTCSATRYWLGCSAVNSSCVDTGKVTAATDWFAPAGTVVSGTQYKVGASCATAATFCDTTDHCSGDDWWDGYTCDGGGACSGDMADLGCCDHSDCGATEYCNAADHQCTALPLCTKRSGSAFGTAFQTSSEDLRDECDPSGFDACIGTCEKTMSNTGFCSGTAAACGTGTTTVAAGKVCGGGNEVSPSAAFFCDVTIDCATGDCSSDMWYRGCAGTGTACGDTGKVTAGTWYAGAGVVINENATNSASAVASLTCATADIFCSSAPHCSGNDWYSGFSCDGAGGCTQDKGDGGCCNHTDCASAEYCDATSHACTALPTCAKRSGSAYGYDWQSDTEDLRNECTASGWDSCNGTCEKTMSNTGFCSGVAAVCGTDATTLSGAGKVCSGGSEVNPSVGNKCDTTVDCVDNSCAADTWYRGCQSGGSSCVDVNRQAGPTWFAPNGTSINGTSYSVGTSCASNTDLCSGVGHCVGNDWYEGYTCNGSGSCSVNQGDVGCCMSSDCPIASEYCDINTHNCEDLPICTERHDTLAYGYQNQAAGVDVWSDCTPGTFDSCQSICVKQAAGGDFCDGNGSCEPFELEYVGENKVCVGGSEVAPSAGAYCDQTLDCQNGACAADRFYRGCQAASSSCTNSGPVAGGTWNSGAGNVISVTEYKVGGSCQTSTALFCDGTNHCSGDDWFDGYTCNASGSCSVDKTDVGCCLDSDCAAGQYCNLGTHACGGLVTPTILSVTPQTTQPLNSELAKVDVTWSGTLPASYEYHLEEVTPTPGTSYYGTGTSFATGFVGDNVLYCYRLRIQDAASPAHWSAWSSTVCAFTEDRTPTFIADAGHSAVTGAGNRVDTSFTANDSGLVLYMPFEEGSGGTTVERVSGTAQAISGATWTTGQMGSALEFDGSNNDWVEMPDTAQMGTFTLSTWVYNASGGSSRHSMVRNFWEIVGTEVCFWSYDFANDYWRCSGAGTVPLNAWSYVATTWDGSVIRHYVDGELVWTDGSTSSGTSQALTTIAGYSPDRIMKGKLDELRIYNRTLDQAEIRDDMIGGVIETNVYRSRAVNGEYVPKYSADSCGDIGWTNAASFGSAAVCGASPGCYSNKTWSQAKAICEDQGGRLCTATEVAADEAKSTGCGFDNARVWSSTQCGSNSYYTLAGASDYIGTWPLACTAATDATVEVRCCADVTPNLSTSSLQDSESWDWNAPNTPSAPVVAVLSDTEMSVQWSAPADQGVTYYYYTKTFDAEGNESNLVQHHSFEDATDHSSGSYGAYSFATDAAHTGSYSLKATGSGYEYELHPGAAKFEPGATYRIGAWVREDPSSSGCDQYLHARWWFAGGTPETTSGGDVPADGQWHWTSTTITLSSSKGAITDMAWYVGYDPDCVGSRWVDDLEIVEITSASLTAGTKDFQVEETTGHGGASGYGYGSATNYNDTGLTGSTEYCYRLRARDYGNNTTSWSSQTCATTDPSCEPPTGVDGKISGADSGQACGGDTVTLTATASGGYCTGQIQYRWYVGATPVTSWSASSAYSPVVSGNTTYQVRARCNACASPEATDNVAVTLYECCADTDCAAGNYCSSHVCTPCTAAQCSTIANCRNGTGGCCDADSDCNAGLLQYCDDGDNSGRPYICETAISLARGTSTGASQISTGTVKDIGWYANFTSTTDACVRYDTYDVEDSSQFDIRAAWTKVVDAAGGGNELWLNYMWYDLSGQITSTGNQVVEFDAETCCHTYRNVTLGWIRPETGAVDGASSTSCCDAATDCVDDYVANGSLGCYDTNSWRDTGGGHGADTEQCRGGVWYTPDQDQTTCTNGGNYWFAAVSGGSYNPCCGDDGGSDDFYHHSAAPATATTVHCRRCLDGAHTYTTNLRGNGYQSGTTCYYGDITCNASTATSSATCTMTNASAKCVAGTTAAEGCGTHGIWTGNVNTDWFNTGNWDDYVVPTSTSAVTIPGSRPNYPNITSGTANANYIIVNGGASLTLSGGTLQISGNHPDYGPESIRNFGTVTASGGTLNLKGILNKGGKAYFSGATVNFSSHMYNYNGYVTNEFNISAGTVNAQSVPNYEGKIVQSGGTLNIAGYYREADTGGGMFQGDGGTVNFSGTSYIRPMKSGTYFPTVNISGTREIFGDSAQPFNALGDFTINSGATFNANGMAMTIQEDWVRNGTFNHGNNTVTFSGSKVRQIRGSATTFYNLIIDGPNAYANRVENGTGNDGGLDVTVNNDLTVKGYFEINDKSSGTTYIDVHRDVAINSLATFGVNDTGQWIFVRTWRNWNKQGSYETGVNTRNYFPSSGTSTIYGATSFQDLYFDVPGKQTNFQAGQTTTVKGVFYIAGNSGSKVVLRSTTGSQWYLKNTGSNNVAHVNVQLSNASSGNTIDARNGGVDAGSNNNWLFPYGCGHTCSSDSQCLSGNCDADWSGTKRCHATATSCVNDSSCGETASGGTWKCVETGASAEDASTKVCSSGTWVTTTCAASQWCNSSGGACTACALGHCMGYQSCRDGANGICCDVDSECGASKICVNEGMGAAAASCAYTYSCRSVETLALGTESGAYSGGAFYPSNCGDHAWQVPANPSGDLCIRYSVYNDSNHSNALVLTENHGDAVTYTHSPLTGAGWRHNFVKNISDSTSNFIQFDIRDWDTGFDNVMFGYLRTELGGADTDGGDSTGCCDSHTDCVDDSSQGNTGYSASVLGCYNTSSCKDTGSSASSQHGGYEYCASGTWQQQDDSSSACNTCDNWTCSTGPGENKWSLGGAGNCGTQCCGDDAGEYIRFRISFPSDNVLPPTNQYQYESLSDDNARYWVQWGNSTGDTACCDTTSDCVYDHVCYRHGTLHTGAGTGADREVMCYSGEWRDLDGNQGWCTSASLHWVLASGTPGEYGSWTNGGVDASSASYPSQQNPYTTYECCGDDAGEYYQAALNRCLSSTQ